MSTVFLGVLWVLSAPSAPRKAFDLGHHILLKSLSNFIQIFFKNAKIEEKVKADYNRSPTTGLSGKVLIQIRVSHLTFWGYHSDSVTHAFFFICDDNSHVFK